MSEQIRPISGAELMSGEQVDAPRVLVVRSEDLRDRVGAALAGARIDAEVASSPSYLSAMGWLTHEYADVIIGPVSAMTGMVGSTARALRRLAPGTRLIVVATQDERTEAGAALMAGFDECLFEPADATELLSMLGLVRNGQAAQAANAPTQEDTEPETPQPKPEAKPAKPVEQDWLRHAFEPATPLMLNDEIGDVDLVEAVLRDDGSLLHLAMHLLRKQSGLTDAQFVALGDESSASVNVIDVVYAERVYGKLASATAEPRALVSWGAWLARWVALDRQQSELYAKAMRDELTGLWNRRYFDRFLERVLDHAAQGRQQVTLLVFDIDNFKIYNDNFGHPAGDEILRSTASLIQSLVREHDVVARIGGDEFAVIFWDKGEPRHPGSQHPDNVIGIAKRFQEAICEHRFPKLGNDADGRLTVSGGLAGFPWDGRTPEELLARADAMAIQSKRQGKNAISFGPGAAPNGNGAER